MTNEQIVMQERINAMEKGIIGTTGRMLETADGQFIPEPEALYTFQAWKELGFKIIKGQHAVVTTKLWKKKKQKDSDSSNEETIDMNRDYYLCKAFLFSQKQVERIA